MRQRLTALALLLLLLGGCAQKEPAGELGLTASQRQEEFQYLCDTLEELYPFWGEVGLDKQELFRKYQGQVKQVQSDLDYINLLADFFNQLRQNGTFGHLSLSDAPNYVWLVETYKDTSERAAWEQLLLQEKTVETYAKLDPSVRGSFQLKSKEQVADGQEQDIKVGPSPKEISFEIINDGKTAYLHLPSFDGLRIEKDGPMVEQYLKQAEQYEDLILDIRGNGGGSDNYWMDYIIAPYISQDGETMLYYLYNQEILDHPASQPFMKEIHEELYAQNVSTKTLPNLENLSPYVSEFEFFVEANKMVEAKPGAKPFPGKVWLLTDRYNGSASEGLIDFCNQNGFATIVGERSGGNNCNGDPTLFALPHSGLVFRMDLFYPLNPDGSCNAVGGPLPDILCDSEDALDVCLAQINGR